MKKLIPSSGPFSGIALRGFLALLFVMYPVGMVLSITGSLPNKYLWTTSVFLGVQFVVTFLFLTTLTKWSRTVAVSILILVVSILIEYVGVTTGVPFGSYYYSYFLAPFVVGNVPWAISFAWYALVVNTFLVLRFLPPVPLRPAALIGNTALAVLAIDLVLEPFASSVSRYWTWTNGSIPAQNYAAWFGLALIFAAILTLFLQWKSDDRHSNHATVPGIVLGMNLLQFGVLNVINGYWMETVLGGVLIGGMIMQIIRRPAHAV